VQLVYFAKVREAIGLEGEDINPPSDVNTVHDMIAWLRLMSPAYAAALGDAKELAIFPPVTGG
jgi:molybdopterin synthase sulfur carrier subunit